MALVTVQRSPVAGSPHFSNSDGEPDDIGDGKHEKSECFFAGKGTALVLALKDIPAHAERRLSTDSTRSTNSTQSNNSDIQLHLQSMFNLLHQEETLKMAVKLESQRPNRTRYLVIASRCCYRAAATISTERRNKVTRHNSVKATTSAAVSSSPPTLRQLSVDSNRTAVAIQQQQSQMESTEQPAEVGAMDKRLPALSVCTSRQSFKCDADRNNGSSDGKCNAGIEESCLLGIDCNERTTLGLVVPILADTTIHLDGDGGFTVSVYGKTHIFKPVSVQAMWSALQTLHKVSQKARENNFYPGGPSHDWLAYYQSRVESDQSCLNEWNAMDSLESRRPPSPDAIRNKPTAKEETESVIKMKLKEIMMSVDLDEVTSKYIRGRLEEHLDMDLGEYKSFIDEEMLMILGQMDAPTEIFEHVYLGSEWNASNLEELQKNGVHHILNVTREIDNFFPGMFDYFNVRVYDDEKTNLLKHWDNTFRYITKAKAEGSKVLVHCKMGVSRSASVVIAYAMKAYNWEFQQALQHVKGRRNCIKPNKNFLNQLETYRGMLDAMKNKEKLQRSKSETNLKSTKDARLLPGSEPTPLIQALNQSKSKSMSNTGSNSDGVEVSGSIVSINRIAGATENKKRRLVRRSSSTSPKSIPQQSAIVMKQQSQSLENLTPERSVADEPKNVRFPGSNGENYSVTQNQVLHIQKNTPPPPPPPPMPTGLKAALPVTSVRNIVNDLESHKEARKTADDRKTLNLQISGGVRMSAPEASVVLEPIIGDELQAAPVPVSASSTKSLGSPVWTSSAKLITQTSNLKPSSETVAATAAKFGSNSSIDSASSTATTTTSMPAYEGFMRPRPRQRELPSRHASWGSGDNRTPMRNSSWGSYDTNRNNFQYGCGATAIFEGQIHELNMSNKTALKNATSFNSSTLSCASAKQQQHNDLGTIKHTKQKLAVSANALKKPCSENPSSAAESSALLPHKRSSNLFRSVSAAGSMRSRYPQRCNSDEITQRHISRHSEGSRPLHDDVCFEGIAACDLQNKNMLSQEALDNASDSASASAVDDDEEETSTVELRKTQASSSSMEDQRVSGNVQILKKNFEAKAGGNAASGSTVASQTNSAKKGHQSLPSSPVAQHVEHGMNMSSTAPTTTATSISTTTTNAATTASSRSSSSSSSNSTTNSSCTSATIGESCDRNVKGLVHKYQTTKSSGVSLTNANNTSNVAAIKPNAAAVDASATFGNIAKPRPRSYYESTRAQKSITGKPHDFSDSRPPPAPPKFTTANAKPTHNAASAVAAPPPLKECIMAQQQQQQQPPHHQHRRLQQHGKTHPLARLSLPKQSFNAAAYNTILFRMLRTVNYSFNTSNNSNNNKNHNNNKHNAK